MQGYIDEIKHIIETMPHNESVNRLIKAIGPFYEFVEETDESENDDGNVTNDDDKIETNNLNKNTEPSIESNLLLEKSTNITSSYDMLTSLSLLDSAASYYNNDQRNIHLKNGASSLSLNNKDEKLNGETNGIIKNGNGNGSNVNRTNSGRNNMIVNGI
jgi:hypothetical protein